MKKLVTIWMVILLCMSLTFIAQAYSDEEINQITNVVNGEVGGIQGTVLVTYADGSQEYTDGHFLRMVHACVVDNQVNSDLFPSSLVKCIRQCWSSSYTGTSYRSNKQWKRARESVIAALDGEINVPTNVFAATCDPYFASRYKSYQLWARVDWDTGWVKGTFYYYSYGAPIYAEKEEDVEENDIRQYVKNRRLKEGYLCQ